jgi:OFA family oxalate/formate antiporter-like MFS transporter
MKIKHRWFVVVGAVMIQLALGAIYAWSVFTRKLTDPESSYGFSATEAAWVFSAGLATFALVMVLAGKLQARFGPMKVSILGGILLGTGYILGGLFGSTFPAQLLFIGILGGAGIGTAYVVPIAVGVKWFPDKKGLITGLAVAGFGFGATIWVKLAGSWFGGLLNTTSLFGLPGVQSVFIIYGIVFAALVIFGSLVMVNPPEGYLPPGLKKRETRSGVVVKEERRDSEFSPGEMLRTRQFYMLWSVFIFSAIAGLMVIYCIRLFGIDALTYNGVAEAGVVAGTAMAWYAIFNGLGRIFWGSISDKIGRKRSILIMTVFQGIAMLSVYHGFITFASATGLIVCSSIIGFNFGGNFALIPAATADYFGNKNVGANYGFVFTAYGIAGILGPQLAGYFKDAAVSAGGAGGGSPFHWMAPFLIAGLSCFVASVITAFIKAPEPPTRV